MFLSSFLLISSGYTVFFLVLLLAGFYFLYCLGRKRVDFSVRTLLGMAGGMVLGLLLQCSSGFSDAPADIPYIGEVTAWYGLFGNGFLSLIKMLVVPLVVTSMINVVTEMDERAHMGKLVKVTVAVTILMAAVAAGVGLLIGILFRLGTGAAATSAQMAGLGVAGTTAEMAGVGAAGASAGLDAAGASAGLGAAMATAEMKEVVSVVATLQQLIPDNLMAAMVNLNVIGLVIFAMLTGMAARNMHRWQPEVTQPFYQWIKAMHRIVSCMADQVIELLPYGVLALLANTVALRGIRGMVEVGRFIVVLYLAVAAVFCLQLLQLLVFGVGPFWFIKKSIRVMVMAFTSRSSVGTLPYTIKTLTEDMGVHGGTASFCAGFGSTAGMQGCAGVFPALLVVFAANVTGCPIDVTLVFTALMVISLGSLGIAGIPGTAAMAASVTFSGLGMQGLFPLISPILSIDPIIDMGRTLVNVTGAMANTIVVDRIMRGEGQK